MPDWKIGFLLMLGSSFITGTVAAFRSSSSVNMEMNTLCVMVFIYCVGVLLVTPTMLYGTSIPLYIGYVAGTMVAGVVTTAAIFLLWLGLFFLYFAVTGRQRSSP